MKFSRPQLSALAILLCFVTSSVLGRVITTEENEPEPWKVALHNPCDIPQSDTQLPFEEKEKELEDKSDTDTDPVKALDTYVVIFDFEPAFRFAEEVPFTNSLLRGTSFAHVIYCPAIFILDGALLI